MITKGLSRGEILIGLEQGFFKEGDKFSNGCGGFISIDDNLTMRWEVAEDIVFCAVDKSKYDLIEESQFKVDDVLFHYKLGIVKVYKVNGYHVYFTHEKGTDWFNIHTTPVKDGLIRHAKDEEIVAEKKRIFWSKLGREVNEYRKGDICVGSANDLMEVVKIDGNLVQCRQFDPIHQLFETFNVHMNYVLLIIPVEQRTVNTWSSILKIYT